MIRVRHSHATLGLAGLFLVLLMLILLPGVADKSVQHETLRGQLQALEGDASRFRELVLGLRHGLNANYDEANMLMDRMVRQRARLDTIFPSMEGLGAPWSAYRDATESQASSWEQFKRYNAVIQNSLRYFQSDLPGFIKRTHGLGLGDAVHDDLSRLSTALLLQALGEGIERREEILSTLDGLDTRVGHLATPLLDEFKRLEQHARIIVKHSPVLHATVSSLVHSEARSTLSALALENQQQLLDEKTRSSRYRAVLMALVALLAVGLVLLALRYLDSQRRITAQGEFLRNVTNAVEVGVLALDGQDRVVFANAQLEKMLGLGSGRLLGRQFHGEGFHVDAWGRPVQAEACLLFQARHEGVGQQGRFFLRAQEGDIIPVHASASPLQLEGDTGLVVVFQDISRQLQEEKALRLSGTVFESSQQGIVITDHQGTIVRANPAYCRMTGYALEELIGQNPRLLKSGLQDRGFYSNMWAELLLHGRWQGELYNRRKNGERYVQWANIDAVCTETGEMLYVGITSDISELVHTRERLANLAYYDTLTGLPNRVLFQDRLAQALAQARRDQTGFGLILADLDNFKTVNDTLGHAAGDDLLVEVGQRLRKCVREADTVARLGGDEFALILMRIERPEQAANVAASIIDTLSRPYQIQGLDITGGASLGITFWPLDGDDLDGLLKNADVAMYRAKERGRNNYQFFTSDMADNVADALRIESSLRKALENQELTLYYQPQINPDGQAVSAEALMRWHSEELGWVPPSRFIPVAERSGLIGALGEVALRQACRQCQIWRASLNPEFTIAVNLSAAQFKNEGLIDHVALVLHEFGLPGSALELEITEGVVMEDVARGQAVLKELKRLGCRLAIDDFGTGYSSLAYLKRFPVDVLKIDKSFIDGLGVEADDTAVAEAIVGLARSLNLQVVAEGVETAAQLDMLRQITQRNGYLAQGYFYAPPIPPEDFEQRYPAFRQLKLVGDREVS